jgi:7-cyano-7-deazaguanine synthase in queuosine biosynthesis
MKKNKKHVVVSLSGGMDSSTLLLRCLKEYDTVTAISFDYGQKHKVELERAQSLIGYLSGKDLKIANRLRYRVIKLAGLTDLLDSALVNGGDEVPEGHYAEDNMKATVVQTAIKYLLLLRKLLLYPLQIEQERLVILQWVSMQVIMQSTQTVDKNSEMQMM